MSWQEEWKALFEQLGSFKSAYEEAEILSVDEHNMSCSVKLKLTDVEEEDVRLKATLNGEANGFFLIPKVGSTVLLGKLNEDSDTFVLATDELSKVIYKTGTFELVMQDGQAEFIVGESKTLVSEELISWMSGGKFELKNSSTSLKEVLDIIIQVILGIVVVQGKTTDVATLQQASVKLNELMN